LGTSGDWEEHLLDKARARSETEYGLARLGRASPLSPYTAFEARAGLRITLCEIVGVKEASFDDCQGALWRPFADVVAPKQQTLLGVDRGLGVKDED